MINTIIFLIISCLILILFIFFVMRVPNKKLIHKYYLYMFSLFVIWILLLIVQILVCNKYDINPIYFDYFIYIPVCFIPPLFFVISLLFANKEINTKKLLAFLFIIPSISMITLWTNDFHSLFYKKYSVNLNEAIFGDYSPIHLIYTYSMYGLGIFIFLKHSIKNSNLFSKQAILIIIGTLIPLSINLLGTLKIINMTIYLTPISFAAGMIFYFIAIFKFNFLNITSIALEQIVNRMSDSYIVLNDENTLTDFNKTFLDTFELNNQNIKNKNLFDVLTYFSADKEFINNIANTIINAKETGDTIFIEKYFSSIDKYFHIEITSIFSNKTFLGTLILLKDITQHIKDMNIIKANQERLIEQERLVSLGQMIGGMAHNLKTPIMSISGTIQGLSDLVEEYDKSIGDDDVTIDDHHQIAKEMIELLDKEKLHLSYMSDVISAVKGQAVTFSNDSTNIFTIKELVKYINILIKHELENSFVNMKTYINVDENLQFNGNINSLVQVINNIISNSIEAYNGIPDKDINFSIYVENDNLVFKVEDFAGGLPDEVQNKLFKEMITTKGKGGTGLGLFMSYSNIKAHFNGDIEYETKKGYGTTFYVKIPIN